MKVVHKIVVITGVFLLMIISFTLRSYSRFNNVEIVSNNNVFIRDPEANIIKSRLKKHVEFLTSVSPSRNYENLASLNKCADYIAHEFKTYSNDVKEQKYLVEGDEYKNVICILNATGTHTIVIGAHYDVCGEQPGADDNASAIAGLLEIGRLLSKLKLENLRIELVAYTLEEPPFFRTELMGSYQHAKMLKDNKINIDYMICLEMIGYYTDKKESQKYPFGLMSLFYGNVGNFIAVVEQTGQDGLGGKFKKKLEKNCNTKVKYLCSPKILHGIDFSDHMNYWKQGYKAIMITDTAFYRNKNYHQQTDTMDTLNFNIMADVVIGLSKTIILNP